MKKERSGKRFRATLGGGYKKADVNAYIEEIQAEFVSVEATLKGQIDRQSAQIRGAEEAAAEAKAKIAELEAQVASLKEVQSAYAAATEELTTLRAENSALSSENTALVEKHQALAAEYLALQEEKTAVEEKTLLELEEKAAAFDRMSADFGAIMLRANENAEAIVRSAKARAQATSDGLIGTLDGRLRKINADCRDDIVAELEELRTSVGAMLSSMKTKYADIGARIDHAKTEMQSERDRLFRAGASVGHDFMSKVRKK